MAAPQPDFTGDDRQLELWASKLERIEQFQRLGLLSGSVQTLEEFLPHALERSLSLLRADSGSLLLRADVLGDDPEHWVMASAASLPGWDELAFPAGADGTLKLAAEARAAVTVPDVSRCGHFNPFERELLDGWGVASVLGVRLRSRRNETIGVLFANWYGERGYTKEDISYLTHAAPLVGHGIDMLRAGGCEAEPTTSEAQATFLRSLLLSSFQGKSLAQIARQVEEVLGSAIRLISPQRELLYPTAPGAVVDDLLWRQCQRVTDSRRKAQRTESGVVVPIVVNGTTFAYLSADVSDAHAQAILSEAASLISTYTVSDWTHHQTAPGASSVLDQLLAGGSPGEVGPTALAALTREANEPYRLLVVGGAADAHGDSGARLERAKRDIARALNAKIATTHGTDVVCVIGQEQTPSASALTEVRSVIDALSQEGVPSPVVVCTRSFASIADVRSAYHEAGAMVGVARTLGRTEVWAPEELGVYEILLLGGQTGRTEYVERTIGRILEHDRVRSSELLLSLEAFLDESCSVSSAATRLFVHPNTLRYRLSRIQQLLDADLDRAEDRLAVHLAIKASRHLSGDGPAPRSAGVTSS